MPALRPVTGGLGQAIAGLAVLGALACHASRSAERRPEVAADRTPLAGSTVYACSDGVRFSVRPIGDSLLLVMPDRLDTLARVEAASGARYAGRGVVFWSKGEESSLDIGGSRHGGCRGRRAGDPWEEAALMGVEFRAIGQEPGWTLDLVDGRWLRYVGEYGATRLYATAPRQVRGAAPGTAAYDAEPAGHQLRVELSERPCQDAMSGESFSHTVTVRLDGRAVEGCGRMTPPGELTNKYWKLTELDGEPVVVGQAREPHLRLQAADSHVAGSTGCNSLSGTFERHGDRLAFGHLVTTLMACSDSTLARQEQHLLEILPTVDRAGTVGERLTLYAQDRPVARFVAVYFQ